MNMLGYILVDLAASFVIFCIGFVLGHMAGCDGERRRIMEEQETQHDQT